MTPIPADIQPLTPANLRDMNGALHELNKLTRKIELACEAGRDCDAEIAMQRYLTDSIQKIKSVYFPDKP